jgi:hypothetical protein
VWYNKVVLGLLFPISTGERVRLVTSSFEKVFPGDVFSKRERVERTLNLLPVDRIALHEQLSYNPGVISLYTGRDCSNFNYTLRDIGAVIRQTVDACFPPIAPQGTARVIDEDGFVLQYDDWTSWVVSRPFHDVDGAREFLQRKTDHLSLSSFDAQQERERFHAQMGSLQRVVGETVIIDYSIEVGFCNCWSRLGLELFTYLYSETPEVISNYVEAVTNVNLRRLHAVADRSLSPVVLIAEDFASKGGPIFSPAFLRKEHFPRVRRLTEAWHSHGIKVIYHSDGNWKSVIPDLVACGVDGFYCLEPSLGMDIVELCSAWPQHVWAGGLDGVDLMERGRPEDVKREVRRQILETNALKRGGIFLDSSSEINPPVKPENFRAMVEAVGEIFNPHLTLDRIGEVF